jgi:hypothetical protein
MDTTTSRRGGSPATTLAGDPFEQKLEKNISQDQTLARRKKGLSEKRGSCAGSKSTPRPGYCSTQPGHRSSSLDPMDSGRDLKLPPHWLGCLMLASAERTGVFASASEATGEP